MKAVDHCIAVIQQLYIIEDFANPVLLSFLGECLRWLTDEMEILLLVNNEVINNFDNLYTIQENGYVF